MFRHRMRVCLATSVAVLGFLLLSAGCGSQEICSFESTPTLVRPAGEECPTDFREVVAALGPRDGVTRTKVHSLTGTSDEPALTICWYRWNETEFGCPPDYERVSVASRVAETDDGVIACEAGWFLRGRVLPAPLTPEDPNGLVPPDPATCPAEITEGEYTVHVLEFVGADQVPARVFCTYAVTEYAACGSYVGPVPGFGGLK